MTKKNLWRPEEDKVIVEQYKTIDINELALLLPDRTKDAIKQRAQVLGVSTEYLPWSTEEIDILKTNYPVMGKRVMRLLPNRSLKNIQVTAYRLGIKRRKSH